MNNKPSLPKGTRDFLPEQVAKRKYLLGIIKSLFKKYGFQEIETPAMEKLSTLTGKYGDEGDKLLFKILNSGDFLSKANDQLLSTKNSKALTARIAEKGLRYDLTVPLARYVVQHQHELAFPFKRYHIGPVWRADRPQKGRYREFYQCDADVIGSDSIINEMELTSLLCEVFLAFNIEVSIRINDRAILEEMIDQIGGASQFNEIRVIIDKMDKIGLEGVEKELLKLSLNDSQIKHLQALLDCTQPNEMRQQLKQNDKIEKALQSIEKITGFAPTPNVKFDPSLARGLDYYTGIIWEVTPLNIKMGSIAAGGRYANLTEMFGGKNLSGVGISFGIERIYDIMQEQQKFPTEITVATRALIINFDEESESEGIKILKKLRNKDIASEIYPSAAKLKKQMKYADQKNIPYTIFIGEEELKSGNYTLKNMTTGEQELLSEKDLINTLLNTYNHS